MFGLVDTGRGDESRTDFGAEMVKEEDKERTDATEHPLRSTRCDESDEMIVDR